MDNRNMQSNGSFNFDKLCETFVKIFPDFYNTDISNMGKSQSLDFANRILFEIGPKMRHLKKEGSNQMYRLILSEGQSIYIYTYTFRGPVNREPCIKDNKLYLTLKQAGLLAVRKLCSVLPDVHNPRDRILLTPLSLAVFAPESVSKIAMALGKLLKTTINCGVIVKAIISSCQTDGYRLPHSQCHIALVAIDTTIRVAKDREKLRAYTLRRYNKFGKIFDESQYTIYAQYSKMSTRTNDVLPMPIESPADEKQKTVNEVLRNIVKSTDDPLSGETLYMKSVDLQEATVKDKDNDSQSLPIDIQIEGIDMNEMKSKLITKNK